MAVNDIVGVQIHGRYQSQNIVNVMHYKITQQGNPDTTILDALCVVWESKLKTFWLARHIDTYKLMGLKAFNLSGVNKQPGIRHIDDPGAVTGTETPSPVCRVITLYTESENYRRRGRVMLSGSEDLQFNDTDGAVTTAEIALLNDLGAELIKELDEFGNAFLPGLAATLVLPFEPYVSYLGRKTPALIRSRRVRGFSIG